MKRLNTVLMYSIAFVLSATLAFAVPSGSFEPDPEATSVVEESPEPDPSPSEEEEELEETEETEELEENEETEENEEGESSKLEGEANHGMAVSTAAKCPVKGRAHGGLVRSVAKDKAATVESAQAACDAALAAAGEGTTDKNEKKSDRKAGSAASKGPRVKEAPAPKVAPAPSAKSTVAKPPKPAPAQAPPGRAGKSKNKG